jgi:hypothetical protein
MSNSGLHSYIYYLADFLHLGQGPRKQAYQ